MTAVDAIVLTYDGRHLLEHILPSLAAQTHAPLTVTVVDNGSSDGTQEWLAEHWPDLRVVRIESNAGVAAALNRGVRETSAPLVALLNNDLELEPDWVAEMVRGLEEHPEAGCVACKLLNFRRREELDGAGDAISWNGTARQRGKGQPDRGQYDEPAEIFGPTAGAALYRREALESVGPFDESFFAYFEDVDWGLRAQLAGRRCWYVPSAVGYHMGSETTKGAANPRYYALQRRNSIALLVKDVPGSFLIRHAPQILRHQLGGLVLSARAGMLAVHVRALVQAARMLPGWLRERRRIQRGRLAPLEQLLAIADRD